MESKIPNGQDPLVDYLREHQIPVTRGNYLAWAYPDDLPEMWDPKLEATLPWDLREWESRAWPPKLVEEQEAHRQKLIAEGKKEGK
ncbi:MAG: hypothetical protein M3463_06995 [Verrucomicrobiota bacterium]|nr:hypothetical protein [Verrucomicrobiota bacterium]